MKRGGWYGHPVGAVCAALAVLAVSWYTLSGADMGPREDSSLSAFIVTLRHDAHDARDIERTIAVPIEDALAAIPGISGSMSYSEYGLASVVVRFAHGTKTTEKYDAVREAVQRVYESLPDSVERPSIRSTSEGSDPVWTAAVISGEYAPSELGSFLDRTVRPRLEK
ncbi:MAG: efflux RND transporter permease subunit, partial [Spirochaetales bacterium]|nr:efflux RND transporter permease subunit [Spirochaetales bacterium]